MIATRLTSTLPLLAVLLLVGFVPSANGQDTVEQETKSTKPETVDEVPLLESLPADVPEYYISQLDIVGEAVEDRAELTVSVVIFVTRPDIWQTVPLRMPKATVLSREYDGVGEAAPLITETSTDGLTWCFRGAGRHELNLGVHVPLQRTPTGQRLDMTLPRMPDQFRGRLTLSIPETPVEVTSEDFAIRPLSVLNDRTRVEAFIPGGGPPVAGTRFNLSWSRPSGEAPGTVAAAITAAVLQADPASGRWILSATQTLRAVTGGLSIVRVRLPDGFDLVDVTGPRVAERIAPEEDTGRQTADDRWVTVRLDNSPSQTAELSWQLTAPFDPGRSIYVTAFEVETARRQNGTVRVRPVQGFLTSVAWDDAEGVRRVGISTGDAVAAAEFSRPSFRLPVQAAEEKPFTIASPLASLRLRGDSVELRQEFNIAVRRGQIDQLEFEWPTSKLGEWSEVEPIAAVGLTDLTLSFEEDRAVGRLIEPRAKDFRVAFLARRPLRGEEAFGVGVARVNASEERPTRLEVLTVDGVDAELSVADESALRPAPELTAERVETPVPDGFRRSPERFRIFGEPSTLRVRREFREAVSTASVTLRAVPNFTDAGGLSLRVSQSLDFQVENGQVQTVLLQLPEAFTTGLDGVSVGEVFTFRLDGEALPPSAVQTVRGSVVRVSLPEPRSTFRVELPSLSVPLSGPASSDEAAAGVFGRIPIARAVDAESGAVRLEVEQASLFDVEPGDGLDAGASSSGWVQSPTSERDREVWVRADVEEVRDVSVTMAARLDASVATVSLDSAEVVIRPGRGATRITATYEIADDARHMSVVLPASSENRRFTWNGNEIAGRSFVSDGDLTFTFAESLANAEGGSLGISYDLPSVAAAAVNGVKAQLPSMPGAVRTAETSVVLALPSDQLLLRSDASLTPLYRWERTGLWFSRVSQDANFSEEATYQFAAYPQPDTLRFVTVGSRPLVVGCSFAVFLAAVGFCLLRPGLRLTAALACLIALAVASVWVTETLLVLAQPAIVGLVAFGIARALNKRERRYGNVLQVPSASVDRWAAPHSDVDATVIRGRSSVSS